jgi:hypothetical protein
MIMCAYDEARSTGLKHSAAVREVVDRVKRLKPELCISETEVKRTLATWRPKGSQTILRFERSVLSGDDAERHRWILKQLAMQPGNKGLTLLAPPKYVPTPGAQVFKLRFAERPVYPRHNRKSPRE